MKVDSAGCLSEDEIVISTSLTTPNLGSDLTLCSPAFANLVSNVSGTNFTYVWKRDNVVIPNATSLSHSTSQKGNYRLEISASGCTSVSDEVMVNSNLLPIKTDTLFELLLATAKSAKPSPLKSAVVMDIGFTPTA